MNRHKISAALRALDGHSLIMQWGLIDRITRGASGVEHHNNSGVGWGADSVKAYRSYFSDLPKIGVM